MAVRRAVVAAGCNGWAQNLDAMIWPGSLIVGGTQWSDDGATLESAEALETVLRISGTAPILEWNPAFTPKMACELQNRWIDGQFHRCTWLFACGTCHLSIHGCGAGCQRCRRWSLR